MGCRGVPADRGAAGGAGEAEEQAGAALREEVRAGADGECAGGRRRDGAAAGVLPLTAPPLPAVRRRGAVRREEGGPYREALRLPPGDLVQLLPPQVPVSGAAPGSPPGAQAPPPPGPAPRRPGGGPA